MSLKYRTYNIGLHVSFKRIWNFLLSYTKDSTQGAISTIYYQLLRFGLKSSLSVFFFSKLSTSSFKLRCYYLYTFRTKFVTDNYTLYTNCNLNYSRNTFFLAMYIVYLFGTRPAYIVRFVAHKYHAIRQRVTPSTLRTTLFSILYTVVRITRVSSP